jgi:hypothetical protein
MTKAREGGREDKKEDPTPRIAGEQATFGGSDREAEWVIVYVAFGPEEAQIVRQSLMVNDIPAVMRMDSLDSIFGTTLGLGVRVMVPRALEDRALALLDGDAASGDMEDGDPEAAGMHEPASPDAEAPDPRPASEEEPDWRE